MVDRIGGLLQNIHTTSHYLQQLRIQVTPPFKGSNFWLCNPPYDAPRKNKLLKANGKGWPRCIDWKIHAILFNERYCTHETTTRLIWIDVTITIWGTLVYISCMYTNGTQVLLVTQRSCPFFQSALGVQVPIVRTHPFCAGTSRRVYIRNYLSVQHVSNCPGLTGSLQKSSNKSLHCPITGLFILHVCSLPFVRWAR